jgi:hypothetical protein
LCEVGIGKQTEVFIHCLFRYIIWVCLTGYSSCDNFSLL